jgi:hypothetical protein
VPLPLIPVIAALAAGGTLVPHALGGLIVTSSTGYIVGTYLSTATITALLVGSATALGTGVAVVSGAAAGIIGGAGIFGTTIGASGITGFLMSAGLIASTPVWVPVAIAAACVGISYGAFKYYRLREKLQTTPEGEEVLFSKLEAKVIEWLLRRLAKKETTR